MLPVSAGHSVRSLYIMAVHTIKKGLDLPITGEPEQKIDEARKVSRWTVSPTLTSIRGFMPG